MRRYCKTPQLQITLGATITSGAGDNAISGEEKANEAVSGTVHNQFGNYF